jgi:hypothetical protein
MGQWIATGYLAGLWDFPIAGGHISTDCCQCCCVVSHTWRRWSIKWGTLAWTWKWLKHLASCTPSSKGGFILSTARPSSSFEVVAYNAFGGSSGLFLHICWNGQRWAHRNAAQIPRFAKCLNVCNYNQSGWDVPKSHSSKPCGNISEVLGIEWAAPGHCRGCPTVAKQSPTYMAIGH